MTKRSQPKGTLLSALDSEARAKIELTVDDILGEIAPYDAERVELAACLFDARARELRNKEQAVVALLIAAAIRERLLKQPSHLH